MNYKEIAKETIGHLYKVHTSIRKSGIDEKLIALVELRISQINGCAYCCIYHAKELSNFGFERDIIKQASLLETYPSLRSSTKARFRLG